MVWVPSAPNDSALKIAIRTALGSASVQFDKDIITDSCKSILENLETSIKNSNQEI